MRHKNNGFTLAELLIVVAIIAALVAISIPIFSKQLEKSRDAASIANIRSAYAEAVNYAIEYNGTDPTLNKPIKDGVSIWVNSTGYVSAVKIKVNILSHQANDWSGLADSLPFKLIGRKESTALHGDSGNYTTSYRTIYVYFHFDSLNVGEVQDAQLSS